MRLQEGSILGRITVGAWTSNIGPGLVIDNPVFLLQFQKLTGSVRAPFNTPGKFLLETEYGPKLGINFGVRMRRYLLDPNIIQLQYQMPFIFRNKKNILEKLDYSVGVMKGNSNVMDLMSWR